MWLVALTLDSTDTEHFHHRQDALLDSAGLRQHPVPVAFYNFTVYGHLPKSYQSHNTIYVSPLSLPTSTEPPQGRASASFTSVSQDWKLPGVFVRRTSFPGMNCFQVEWIMEWRCKDHAMKRRRWSYVFQQLEEGECRKKVHDRRRTCGKEHSERGGWPEGPPFRRRLWRGSGELKGVGTGDGCT